MLHYLCDISIKANRSLIYNVDTYYNPVFLLFHFEALHATRTSNLVGMQIILLFFPFSFKRYYAADAIICRKPDMTMHWRQTTIGRATFNIAMGGKAKS